MSERGELVLMRENPCQCQIYEICPECTPSSEEFARVSKLGNEAIQRTPQKTAITINLDHLEPLCRAYVAECVPNVNDRLAVQLRLSAFLMWMRKRQEKTNAESKSDS